MARCILLGAGFSKAVADLPLTTELADRFRQIYERERVSGHPNRAFWGEKIIRFFDELETQFFRSCLSTEDQYEGCTLLENFESIVSFIDLNLSGEIRAERILGDSSSDFTRDVLFWNPTTDSLNLKYLRNWIQTYLYLALVGPTKASPTLSAFIESLRTGDSIVTFNYDLIVESALFRRGQWSPTDGYGIPFANTPTCERGVHASTAIPLYKLHGSLNWRGREDIFDLPLELRLSYDDGEEIFPGYGKKSSPRAHEPYQGGLECAWIMPSFMKRFEQIPELLTVWREAFSAIRETSEVVAIGYSLPPEDSAASLLLGTTGLSEKPLTLVDPNYAKLENRYQRTTGRQEILSFLCIDEYLAAADTQR